MAKEWIGIIGSRFVDFYDGFEDELETIIRSTRSRGRGIILSAASGIDSRTLAHLLKFHADDVNFQVHMEEDSVEDFEKHIHDLVDQELLDAKEAQATIDQMKRLEQERPEALLKGQKNDEATECGRYASVIANCDEIFAIQANSNGSPTVEQTIEYAKAHDVKVNAHRLNKLAA